MKQVFCAGLLLLMIVGYLGSGSKLYAQERPPARYERQITEKFARTHTVRKDEVVPVIHFSLSSDKAVQMRSIMSEAATILDYRKHFSQISPAERTTFLDSIFNGSVRVYDLYAEVYPKTDVSKTWHDVERKNYHTAFTSFWAWILSADTIPEPGVAEKQLSTYNLFKAPQVDITLYKGRWGVFWGNLMGIKSRLITDWILNVSAEPSRDRTIDTVTAKYFELVKTVLMQRKAYRDEVVQALRSADTLKAEAREVYEEVQAEVLKLAKEAKNEIKVNNELAAAPKTKETGSNVPVDSITSKGDAEEGNSSTHKQEEGSIDKKEKGSAWEEHTHAYPLVYKRDSTYVDWFRDAWNADTVETSTGYENIKTALFQADSMVHHIIRVPQKDPGYEGKQFNHQSRHAVLNQLANILIIKRDAMGYLEGRIYVIPDYAYRFISGAVLLKTDEVDNLVPKEIKELKPLYDRVHGYKEARLDLIGTLAEIDKAKALGFETKETLGRLETLRSDNSCRDYPLINQVCKRTYDRSGNRSYIESALLLYPLNRLSEWEKRCFDLLYRLDYKEPANPELDRNWTMYLSGADSYAEKIFTAAFINDYNKALGKDKTIRSALCDHVIRTLRTIGYDRKKLSPPYTTYQSIFIKAIEESCYSREYGNK